jgi:4-hydroxybenzoate polyprenyltransferase
VVVAGVMIDFGLWYWIGASIFIVLLVYQHLIIKPSDLSRVNQAFVTLNGIASVVFGVFVSAEIIFTWM